jgi:hypothetical protein
MIRRARLSVSLAILGMIAMGWNLVLFAAENRNRGVADIVARARLFSELGPGLHALKRDSGDRYYVLAAPATTIFVYGSDGKRVGQIPAANSQSAKIVFADDIDIDSSGRVFVADRGANAVKIFKADGSLETAIPVSTPTSVAALPGGEFAITSLRAERLVSIYNDQGKMIRSFGDPHDVPTGTSSSRYINHGRLFSDALGFIYFAFTYLPEATIRKYDRFGYSAYEISLSRPDEQSATSSQTTGVDILALARRNQNAAEKPVINAFCVDPISQEVWAAIGDELSRFDKDGLLVGSYRTATANGARLEPSAILIEPERILLAADPLGVYEFARPDKQRPASGEKR